MITQPLFWKRVLDNTRAFVFRDVNTHNLYAVTVAGGSFSVALVGGQQVSNPFTLQDTSTQLLYNLVEVDGELDVQLTNTVVNVIQGIPISDLVTGERLQLQVTDGAVIISDAPLPEALGLAELLPKVYPDVDADGSLADFIQVYDDQHSEQRAIVEQLATIRTPSLAPLAFIPDIADAMGSPFPFMSAHRWKRGNRLSGLPRIYAERGSAQGIENAIRYLIGVEVGVITYQWILGVSTLP